MGQRGYRPPVEGRRCPGWFISNVLSIPMGQCGDRPFKRTPTLPKRDSKGGPDPPETSTKIDFQAARFSFHEELQTSSFDTIELWS